MSTPRHRHTPQAIWRTTPQPGQLSPPHGLSYPLALRLLAIYSRRRDTVHDATADAAIAAAAATLSRAYRTHPDPAGAPAALVITAHNPATETGVRGLVDAARQVGDGGCLVAVIPAQRGRDRAQILADITAVGLLPIHAIQAITDPAGTTGDRFTYHTPDPLPDPKAGHPLDPTEATHCWLVVATTPTRDDDSNA